jgi:hypothetical protein
MMEGVPPDATLFIFDLVYAGILLLTGLGLLKKLGARAAEKI